MRRSELAVGTSLSFAANSSSSFSQISPEYRGELRPENSPGEIPVGCNRSM